ncbi:MerR family transcriptional regulator [Helicobacter sp.]|nr:MerR family transcriptional regulator [Helicobacter sp.]MDY5557648.1 MerR family transcriptional regulator [Helicobacter sp.]
MAYTIIQVSRKSGIPHSKLKFWLKKGLFSQYIGIKWCAVF